MSLIIKSVELHNMRTHSHFYFDPAIEGVTAIVGENGAGKSTIVDVLAWCFYGTRPSGVKNKNLIKDGVDPKEKPVKVKTIALIGGIEYAVERKIITASGTTECNVWGRKPGTKEFKLVAGPSVTHVEKFLKNIIGMNEKGFLTSVFIQQKQVDQIVSATPRERGAVIEELTGIASITHAISKQNENTRTLEKAASIFQVGNLEETEARVNKQLEVCESLEVKEKEAIASFNKTKENYNKIKGDLDVQEVKVKERVRLTQEVESHKRQVEFLKQQSQDDLKFILDFKEKYGSTVAVNTQESKGKMMSKRDEVYSFESKINSNNASLALTNKSLESCSVLKGPFNTEKKALTHLSKKEKELQSKIKELEELKEKEAMYTSEIKHSKASKEHITGEHKNCPVCKSEIEDPETLKQEIENDIKDFENKKSETKKEIKAVDLAIEELKSDIKETKISIEAIKEESKLLETKEKLESELKEISKTVEMLKSDLKVLEEEYDKSLRIEADKNALEAAKARSLTVNDTIKSNELAIKQLQENIEKLGALTDRSYNALVKSVEDTKDRLARMSIAGQEIVGRKKLEHERLTDYKNDLTKVKEAMKKYKELAKQIEISASASAMLAAFKADRIENAIPTLEFYSSDFLSKFTGGAFAKLSLDEKFNTFVTTSTGIVRPVSQLSGGELSSAAIALRLGIAMLLNSSDKNVLILDEVLVSMDEDRARQIMETISSMTNSQVIFIAHNSDINSIADKTVLVTKQ